MSISGKAECGEKVLRSEEKSGFLVSLLFGIGRFGKMCGKLPSLKRGSKGGGKPFRAALKYSLGFVWLYFAAKLRMISLQFLT